MQLPSLSIIVPVHNSQETLQECLNAISQSDYSGYELIVVDDGSTDKSVDIAKRFPCRIISNKENRGAAAARNTGAEQAKNDILLFIDSDIVVKPNSVSKIINKFNEYDNLAGVAGVYSIPNRFPNFLSQYKHLVACYKERMSEDNISHDSFKGFFSALKKDIFKAHRFDESFKKASIEDIEFGRELVSSGYRFILDKTNEVEHVKKFTVKTYLRNQYNRSRDIMKAIIGRKVHKFYFSTKRKNLYAKFHILRVPIIWLFISILFLFFLTENYILLLLIAILFLIAIWIERNFLKFCFVHKGLLFSLRCFLFYFVDGFISGIGVIRGITEKLFITRS